MAFVSGGVGVYFGPPVLGAPTTSRGRHRRLPRQGSPNFGIAVRIDSRTIAMTVIAKQRHVRVRLIKENDYSREHNQRQTIASPRWREPHHQRYCAGVRQSYRPDNDLPPEVLVDAGDRTTAAVLTSS